MALTQSTIVYFYSFKEIMTLKVMKCKTIYVNGAHILELNSHFSVSVFPLSPRKFPSLILLCSETAPFYFIILLSHFSFHCWLSINIYIWISRRLRSVLFPFGDFFPIFKFFINLNGGSMSLFKMRWICGHG